MNMRVLLNYNRLMLLFLTLSLAIVPVFAEHPICANDLAMLDKELEKVAEYDKVKYNRIDSLRHLYYKSPKNSKEQLNLALRIGNEYESFITDSAMVYYETGIDLAKMAGDSVGEIEARLRKMKVLGVSGFFTEATTELAAIERNPIPQSLKSLWNDAGRQLYIYMLAYTEQNSTYSQSYTQLNNNYRDSLILTLDPKSDIYRFYLGENLMNKGNDKRAGAVLSDLIGDISPNNSNIYARATSVYANIKNRNGESEIGAYYWALSAISDIRNSIKENTSLQNLALYLYARGDIEHAYRYIRASMEDANFCNARLRKMQIASNMPLIDSAYKAQIEEQRQKVLATLIIMSLLSVCLIIAVIAGLMQMRKLNVARMHLKKANSTKEEYMGHFLDLCSIYMSRLDNFCKVVTRKVSTGQLDDLIKMTKSTKFAEEQHQLFYENFDSAFLHIYPNFIDEFNALLLENEQIVIKDYGKLTPELRIFAFLRMGVDDSAKIASFLHYSVNTIYTYRNRMKSKAKNRNTFDDDIMSIGNPKD